MPPPTPIRRPRRAASSTSGQAAIELVALLPLIVLLGLMAWQAVVFGQAIWLSGGAARAAARAVAVGADPLPAARAALPAALARGVRTDAAADGSVTVHLAVPAVVADLRLASIATRARFAAQGPG